MRLCFISDPNSIHTRRWVSWFAQHGHSICLVADIPSREPWPGIELVDLSKYFYAPIIRFPIWVLILRQILHRWKPEILHAHRVNSAGWIGAFSGFHPYMVTPWGSDVFIQPSRSRVARILARYTLKRADLITTNSQSMSEQVIRLGAHEAAIKRVQFGVETDVFNPNASTTQERIDLRRRLSLPMDAPLVVSPRAIRPLYNIDIILKSIPLVRQSFPDAIFLFTDYNRDPEYKQHLDGVVRKLGLEEYIRWLPPISSRSEMAELYRMSMVVVSVPFSDGTPVSVLEAMACGTPVIASDLPSLREFITNGENGWLVPVGETVPLASAIAQHLAQPELAREMGLKANQVVVKNFNYDKEMKLTESIYTGLVKSWQDRR